MRKITISLRRKLLLGGLVICLTIWSAQYALWNRTYTTDLYASIRSLFFEAESAQFSGNVSVVTGDESSSNSSHVLFSDSPATPTITHTIFDFESSEIHWTSAEKSELQSFFSKVYPEIERVYGKRFNETQRIIVHRASQFQEFSYASTPNNMTIVMPYSQDTLIHELTHIFHYPEARMPIASFEEGFARAIDIEVMKKVFGSAARDHYLTDARAYDFYNKPFIGFNFNGSGAGLDSGDFGIDRYAMAALAWTKIYIEDPGFFIKLHNLYYEKIRNVPGFTVNEESILSIIETIKPTVEGLPFREWYSKQYIFNSNPQKGLIVVTNGIFSANHFSPVYRDQYGGESKITEQLDIHVEYKNANDIVFDNVIIKTIQHCQKDSICPPARYYEPHFPQGYSGLYTYTMTGTYNSVPFRQESSGIAGVPDNFHGIGGVTFNKNAKKIQLFSRDNNSLLSEASITNGSFFIDKSEKGIYRLVILDQNDQPIGEKLLTKSEREHFIIFES